MSQSSVKPEPSAGRMETLEPVGGFPVAVPVAVAVAVLEDPAPPSDELPVAEPVAEPVAVPPSGESVSSLHAAVMATVSAIAVRVVRRVAVLGDVTVSG